jgi:hypothetical protein
MRESGAFLNAFCLDGDQAYRARSKVDGSVEPTSQRADDGTRTRDPHLGKVMLYQLSHVRVEQRHYSQERQQVCRERRATPSTRVTGPRH